MEQLLLFTAGVVGGLAGSIAGLASISTYPALLAVGLSPVDANITNAVALVFISAGSVTGSRPELTGQRAAVRRLVPAALAGGIAGALILLLTPSSAFARVVPFLIAGASAVILLPRSSTSAPVRTTHPVRLSLGVAAVSLYCGYFGAAAGVLLMALLLRSTSLGLAQTNAMKNVLLGIGNGVAALLYLFTGRVHWLAALPLAVGLFIGGWTGPAVVRRASPRPLRIVMGLAGLLVAALLFVRG